MDKVNTHMHVVATMTLTALQCQDCEFGGKTDEWMGFVAHHLTDQPTHSVTAVTNTTSLAVFRMWPDDDPALKVDVPAQGKGEG